MADWSDNEVEIIVEDYFSMLKEEIVGKPYNKAEHRRRIKPLLNDRPDASIEFKHQNISAVLIRFGAPYISGYKPRWNYQKRLEDVIFRYIKKDSTVESSFKTFAETPVSTLEVPKIVYADFEDSPPEAKAVTEPKEQYRSPVKRNYLQIEQNNRLLGNSGEKIAIEYERWRLIDAGKNSLADKIEWVAQTQGDGLGYDILSKNVNGTDRYIEVKTTKLGKDAPIFFSKNEYDFSSRNSKDYFLYRLFNFNTAPKAFIVNGRYDDFCKFQAINFRGTF